MSMDRNLTGFLTERRIVVAGEAAWFLTPTGTESARPAPHA